MAFKHLRDIDLTEAPAVFQDWNSVVQTQKFISKLKETHKIHTDRDWLMKSYRKNFDCFRNMYWEIINYPSVEKLEVLEKEVYDCFILFFRFVCGVICGLAVDLSLIQTFASFAQT